MADYGHPVRFGLFPDPSAAKIEATLDLVTRAEDLDLDLVGVQDHPYQHRHLDAMVLLTWIAARTNRIGVVHDVLNLPLRPPGVLGQALASLDVLCGGRLEVGLGAGGFWDAIAALGGPRRSPGEALAALDEAVTVLRAMWGGQRSVHAGGDFYRVDGVHSGPVPAHPMQIWVGGGGPRMLDLIGRACDGWMPSSPYILPADLPARQERIDAAAAAAGRAPSQVRRVYNVAGRITADDGGAFLQGPVQRWVDDLVPLVLDVGMDTFILWPEDPVVEQLELFATQVAPAVREAVATARGRAS